MLFFIYFNFFTHQPAAFERYNKKILLKNSTYVVKVVKFDTFQNTRHILSVYDVSENVEAKVKRTSYP